MASNPTVSDLRKVSEVTDDEITAAVDAVLEDLASEAYPLAKGWILDLVAGRRTQSLSGRAAHGLGRLQAQHGPHRDPDGASGEGMSESVDRTVVQHMMRRLNGFVRGLGLDEATMRQIVERWSPTCLISLTKSV